MSSKERRGHENPSNPSPESHGRDDPEKALEVALQHHQAGRIAQAERIYGQILAAQPNNADALHLLGVAAHQTGRHDRAITFIEKAVRHASANPHYLNNLGEAYRAHARVGEAVGCYRRALEVNPGFAEAHYNLGLALADQGDVAGAVACFRRALEIDADDARTHCTLGDALRKEGDPGEAIACYRRALEIDPGLAEAHNNLGNALSEQGDFDDAVACYRRALQTDPNLARTLGNLGNALRQQDDPAGAVACYRRALEIDPGDAQTHANLGDALSEQENPEAAIACYRRALEIDPGHAQTHAGLGYALSQQDRWDEATVCYRRALEIDPDAAEVHNKLGRALWKQERLDEAIACYRRALEINPNLTQAHNRLGIALNEQGQLDEAIACYRRALEINPNLAKVHNNLGNVLEEQDRPGEAIACYQRAIEINPRYAFAHNNLGNALSRQDRLEEAIASYRRAIEINSDYAIAYHNLGEALSRLGELNEAIACYQRALKIDPGCRQAVVSLLDRFQEVCLWQEFDALKQELDAQTNALIERGKPAKFTPFQDVMIHADPSANLQVAKSASKEIARRMARLGMDFPMEDRRASGPRITLGYLSNDFRNHPVGHLVAGLFGVHDREAFKVIAYSHGKDDGSAYRKRLQGDCDSFVDIRELNYGQAAQRIYDDKVDILVDLNGHTEGNRLEICALRPAPVVATYLGFPGTTGAGFIDYILTDRIVTPEDHAPWYSETFAYLPHCYLVNDHTQTIADTQFTRAECGLPDDAFVFCSFNKCSKIEPVMFGTWMDLLKESPGSVLWLFENHALVVPNLKNEAQARDVNADRLVFADRLPKDQHLARYKLADLALDTRIYNGHVTTSDALWAGVPVITLKGSHFASRVSASILTAIGLPELITHSVEEYEALATRLAQDPGELSALRRRLAENRATEPPFDTPRFVRNLEAAYRQMWAAFQEGAKPSQIEVVEE